MPFAERIITVDALCTVGDTARSIVDAHGVDHLMTVKGNAGETIGRRLGMIDRKRDATGAFDDGFAEGHCRTGPKRIRTMTPLPGTTDHPHVAQILRFGREHGKPWNAGPEVLLCVRPNPRSIRYHRLLRTGKRLTASGEAPGRPNPGSSRSTMGKSWHRIMRRWTGCTFRTRV